MREKAMLTNERAMVVFSGGQDSTTCLAWALERFQIVDTIGFDYGQRHNIELECRRDILNALQKINKEWGKRLGEDKVIQIDLFQELGRTALTHDVAIAIEDSGLPSTFVPGRNIIFLTVAAAYAYRRGIRHLVIGVCETDFSGYPDCRDDTIKAVQLAVNLGMDARFIIHTPLMCLDKAETWMLAETLGGTQLVQVVVECSHTCYRGDRSTLHKWGYGCGTCPACQLRGNGWLKFLKRSV